MEKLFQDDNIPRVSMQIVQNCLVLSVQVELFDATLTQLRADLLNNIRTSGVRRAIIDLSAVQIMDPHAYNSICDSANMAKVMGTTTIVSGIQPGVASALVDLGADVGRVSTTLNLEYGFAQLAEPAECERDDFNQPPESNNEEETAVDGSDTIEKASGGGDRDHMQIHEIDVKRPNLSRPPQEAQSHE